MVVSLTIPDAVAQRVVDAVATKFNYSIMKLPGETQGQFAKRMMIQWLKDLVTETESVTAIRAAEDAARTSVETDIVIT